MAPKPKPTKTINPLHFEDLDPKRFEDLVRRLLYGFRDWDTIEPTGRGGADDGFDARAFEKADAITNADDDGEESTHTLEGRAWQIQSKREKSITPAKMNALIQDGVSSDTPPYGYILAAATNISKATYDVFRRELRAKGVREFYFWGKDHLEDQLSLPINDEILFTFFGHSLSARRRSRTTEIKFEINNKNKILRLIYGTERLQGQGVPRGKTFLLRDIKADRYPHREAYSDFDTHRRWEEHDVIEVAPRGLVFKVRERYAYYDADKKEWDYSKAVDLIPREHNLDRTNQARLEDEGKRAERFWRRLPRRVQAKFMAYGYLPFDDILIIDDRGDTKHTDPHLYIDFGKEGPFHQGIANLVQHNQPIGEDELSKFSRVSIFPTTFPAPATGAAHDAGTLALPPEISGQLSRLRGATTIYAVGGPLLNLNVGDLIRSPKTDDRGSDGSAEVTHLYKTTVGTLVKQQGEHSKKWLSGTTDKELKDSDEVLALEVHAVYDFGRDEPPTFMASDHNW